MDDTDLQNQGQDDDFDSQDLFEETMAVNDDDEDDPNLVDASHVTTLAESRTRQSGRRAVPARVDPGHMVAVAGSVSGRLPPTTGTDRNVTETHASHCPVTLALPTYLYCVYVSKTHND